jgi:hypothetical protein
MEIISGEKQAFPCDHPISFLYQAIMANARRGDRIRFLHDLQEIVLPNTKHLRDALQFAADIQTSGFKMEGEPPVTVVRDGICGYR